MTTRPPILCLLAVASALLAGCAAPRATLLPAPPAEIAREAPRPGPAPSPPPGPDPWKAYGEAVARTRELLRKGEAGKAVPLWDALARTRYAADAVFNQGVLLQLSGDMEGASSLYRRAMAPPLLSEAAAANLLGIELLRGDREALRRFVDNEALPIAALPGNRLPEFSANLFAALIELSRTEEAKAAYRSMVERGVATPALLWNRAVLAYLEGSPADARRFASAVPHSVTALWPVAASRVAWERDGTKVPSLDARSAADPRLLLLSRNLSADDAWKRGDAPSARELLLPAASANRPQGEYLANLGAVFAEEGRWGEARRTLERAVAAAPRLPEGWLNLGMFREMYLGDGPGALECYDRYLTLGGSRKDEVSRWAEGLKRSSSPR